MIVSKYSITAVLLSGLGVQQVQLNGLFNTPFGIAIDSSGNAYVSDIENNRIQKFKKDGTFIRTWGTEGSANGQFNAPFGVGIDSSGNVYVADSGNNRIQKFKNSGTFIRTWVLLVLWLKCRPVL